MHCLYTWSFPSLIDCTQVHTSHLTYISLHQAVWAGQPDCYSRETQREINRVASHLGRVRACTNWYTQSNNRSTNSLHKCIITWSTLCISYIECDFKVAAMCWKLGTKYSKAFHVHFVHETVFSIWQDLSRCIHSAGCCKMVACTPCS